MTVGKDPRHQQPWYWPCLRGFIWTKSGHCHYVLTKLVPTLYGFLRYYCLKCVIHAEVLLIVALWRHIATQTWDNIGSSNGLLPDDTEPLLEPILTNRQRGVVAFTLGKFTGNAEVIYTRAIDLKPLRCSFLYTVINIPRLTVSVV